MKHIYCKGRYTLKGKEECVDKFEYIGEWEDDKLVEHQDKEKKLDTRKSWWTGFAIDKKFENLKSKIDNVKED